MASWLKANVLQDQLFCKEVYPKVVIVREKAAFIAVVSIAPNRSLHKGA